jgi:hypothetical protein
VAFTKKVLVLIALVGLASVGAGRADTLFDNLGGAPNGADPTGNLWGPLADSFSTGSSAFDFNSLTVILTGTPSAGTTTAYLLSDSSATPGSVLEEIGAISESGLSAGPTLYALSTSYILSPDTNYWIELTSEDNSASWQWSLDTSGTGVAGGFFANFQGGDSWLVFPNDNGPYQMQVAGTTAVSEPSSLVLLIAGLAVVLYLAFRRAGGRRKLLLR